MTSLLVLAPPISRTSCALTRPPDEEMTTILAKLSWSVPNQIPPCSDLLVPAGGLTIVVDMVRALPAASTPTPSALSWELLVVEARPGLVWMDSVPEPVVSSVRRAGRYWPDVEGCVIVKPVPTLVP